MSSTPAAIVRGPLRTAIEDHKLNQGNYGFTADDVAALIEGSAGAKQGIFWRDLITGPIETRPSGGQTIDFVVEPNRA